jgi:hypothetical protein
MVAILKKEKMKFKIRNLTLVALLLLSVLSLLVSCDKEDLKVGIAETEVAGLQRLDTLTNGDYTFYIYKKDTGNLVVGYNEVFIQLKNNQTGTFVEDANLSWTPTMQMTSMSHRCPYSSIHKVANTSTLYSGHFIFIMASDDMEYWEIAYNYAIGQDTIAKVSNRPTVVNSTGKIRYKSFIGTDESFYFLALANPTNPKVGANEITALLYKKIDKNTFEPVTNATIELDPRMPDMDNHTSPNNKNLTYDSATERYKGKVNLTMTGYWKVNLVVKDAAGAILKGNAISSTNSASTIYFELEF